MDDESESRMLDGLDGLDKRVLGHSKLVDAVALINHSYLNC